MTNDEIKQLREYKEHHEFAVQQLCELLGDDLKTIGDVVEHVKQLRQLLDDFRKEDRSYCRPSMVKYDMFPVFKRVDEFFRERERESPRVVEK